MQKQAYLGGNLVTALIDLIDTDGDPIKASAVSYRVVNQAETELVASTVLTSFAPGDPQAVVIVPADKNVLAAGAHRELRVIELLLTTDEGTVKLSHEYVIEADQMLTEGVNSFQNYATALLGAYDIPSLPGWDGAEKPQRIAALIQARLNIAQLTFSYVFDGSQDVMQPSFSLRDLTSLSDTEYASLPTEFKVAAKRAQILEADYLLGGDPVGDLRRQGIISSTIGPSTQFFRQRKPLDLPVCKRAVQALGKYVVLRVRLTRVGGMDGAGSEFV
jgi:hypothetical protein